LRQPFTRKGTREILGKRPKVEQKRRESEAAGDVGCTTSTVGGGNPLGTANIKQNPSG
jgi:hypothetical protein